MLIYYVSFHNVRLFKVRSVQELNLIKIYYILLSILAMADEKRPSKFKAAANVAMCATRLGNTRTDPEYLRVNICIYNLVKCTISCHV